MDYTIVTETSLLIWHSSTYYVKATGKTSCSHNWIMRLFIRPVMFVFCLVKKSLFWLHVFYTLCEYSTYRSVKEESKITLLES